ncbi:hypothetical protein PPTG_04912 [Phytophthora nicotianae INRA-310]|uniref:Uncharacterized protein n=1 Tax=Phytophthora nicotianae (strain INRA-310) TaxID=761204 RepID=W2R2L2_PHYN3|nr:hypothetical protein PPTG_04912 [Phytophthora nicotianae INRA-310]ETN19682.1 hypothetical protein PPTG_04912 [Phytophthora nicotianae INRA-310]
MPPSSSQYTMRFRWNAKLKSSSRTPLKLLIRWFSLNHAEYFSCRNYAEVLERFRQELLHRGEKGCTIGDIHSQIVRLISLKSVQMNELREKIAAAGFPRCTARELREQISSLAITPWSPFLKQYVHRLDAIFHGVRVKLERDATANEPRAASSTRRGIRSTRENRNTQRSHRAARRSATGESRPIKTEPCFPDGSSNAPLVVYGDDNDENSRAAANEPTLEEIHRREALVDVRLKYKTTLSEDEIEKLFPLPKI